MVKRLSIIIAIVLLAAHSQVCTAGPGGLERSIPTIRPLFEVGNYFEMSWGHVMPNMEGRGGLLEPASLGTGDLLESYDLWSYAFKTDLNCCNSLAIVLDQPWGVNTRYPNVLTSGYSGTTANLQSNALTFMLSQRLNQHFTLYGGVKAQTVEARASFPFGGFIGLAGPYNAVAERDEGVGFMAGMAFEIKPIKLRFAGSYHSEIETNHSTIETVGATVTQTSTQLTTPQSINLEFQSGISHNTMLFGSVRWVDWSKFAISPPIFVGGVGQPLVDYTEDWITYTVGIGRKFNEYWSAALRFTYEPATDQLLTTLGPIDGRFSVGIAPAFTYGNFKTVVGVDFIELGDAVNFAGTNFDDGEAVAVGIRTSWNF